MENRGVGITVVGAALIIAATIAAVLLIRYRDKHHVPQRERNENRGPNRPHSTWRGLPCIWTEWFLELMTGPLPSELAGQFLRTLLGDRNGRVGSARNHVDVVRFHDELGVWVLLLLGHNLAKLGVVVGRREAVVALLFRGITPDE